MKTIAECKKEFFPMDSFLTASDEVFQCFGITDAQADKILITDSHSIKDIPVGHVWRGVDPQGQYIQVSRAHEYRWFIRNHATCQKISLRIVNL